MALSDDGGETWFASEPLIGFGNIQPTVLRRDDGTLVAYMRENGLRDRIRVSESTDDGMTWGPVGVADLPNPGSGLDGVRLANGHWLLVYNDSIKDRSTLAVSISEDEGRTWPITRHLERDEAGRYPLPLRHPGPRRHDPRRLHLHRRRRREHEARRLHRGLGPRRRLTRGEDGPPRPSLPLGAPPAIGPLRRRRTPVRRSLRRPGRGRCADDR